ADPAAASVAHAIGVELEIGQSVDAIHRAAIARAMISLMVECFPGEQRSSLATHLLETEPLGALQSPPRWITVSGGTSEYVYGRTATAYGDFGLDLAEALLQADLRMQRLPVEQGIRATVLGASAFSVQVSGNTIHVSSADALPLRNLPVVRV